MAELEEVAAHADGADPAGLAVQEEQEARAGPLDREPERLEAGQRAEGQRPQPAGRQEARPQEHLHAGQQSLSYFGKEFRNRSLNSLSQGR